MTKLLNDFMCRCSVEDVVLNRNVLIVKLVKKSKGGDILAASAKSCLAELLGDVLKLIS